MKNKWEMVIARAKNLKIKKSILSGKDITSSFTLTNSYAALADYIDENWEEEVRNLEAEYGAASTEYKLKGNSINPKEFGSMQI
jgi:hypothetical protein